MDVEQFIKKTTVEFKSIEEVTVERLAPILKSYDFCRITGLVPEQNVVDCLSNIADRFDEIVDNPVTGESHEQVKTNFQKMSIGRARHGNVDRPRFMRTIYNPLWCEDIYGMHSNFTLLANIRNLLSGKNLDFAIDKVEEGVWTAARMHHFPTGGGFMVDHRDTVLPKMLKDNDFDGEYYQLLMLLSQKGEDFDVGGGTVEIDGEVLEYEDCTRRGDIIVYNGATTHGVNDIDPHKPFSQRSPGGRYSALATLYKQY